MRTRLSYLMSNKAFTLIIFLLCLIFALTQFYLNSHSLFTPDELWVAHSVYNKYRLSLPYRDFEPYKTIVGYYIFLIPLSMTQDPVTGLIYLKYFLTFINTICLFLCAITCTRFFSYSGIIISIAALISTNFFINYPADIRVDLLAYWCSLFSILFLLRKQFIWAGLLMGLAFCISQKVLWYGIAADMALGVVWLLFQDQRKELYHFILFNLSCLIIISLYLIFWISVSNFHSVINNVFYQAAVVYKINLYQPQIPLMLGQIIKTDLFYLIFWMLSVLSLLVKTQQTNLPQRVFILSFAWFSMLFLIIYKQPFFYSAIAVLPPLLLLYADFFTWFADIFVNPIKVLCNNRYLIYFFIITTLAILSIKIEFIFLPTFVMSIITVLLILMPINIYLCIKTTRFRKLSFYCFYFLSFVAGILFPLIGNSQIFQSEGYKYQQLAIHITNKLLQENNSYIAGVDLLYNKNQPVSGNFFLEQNILFLDHQQPALQPLMLTALDLNPAVTIANIIESIKKQPVKIFIHCEFMDRLPLLLDFLTSQYAHLWGNIYIYGPEFSKGETAIDIKFSGNYSLVSNEAIFLDGKKIPPHAHVNLAVKTYQSIAYNNYRLILEPEDLGKLPNKYTTDVPERLFEECKKIYINHKMRCVYFSIRPVKT